MSHKAETARNLDLKLLSFIGPYLIRHRVAVTLSVLCLLCADAASLSLPFLTRHGIDTDIAQKSLSGLSRTTFFFALALTLSFVFSTLSQYSITWIGQKLLMSLRLDVFAKVLRLPSSFFDRTPTGTVLSHVTSDVEAVRQFISEGLVSVAGDLLKAALILLAMFLVDVKLALAICISIPLFAVATAAFRHSIRTGFRGVRKANGEIQTTLVESIGGHAIIALFRARKSTTATFTERNKRYLDAYRQVVDAYALYIPIIEVLTHVSLGLVMLFAHFQMGASVQPGSIFALFALINMFFRPLRDLAENFNTFQSAMSALERLKRLMGEEEPIQNPRLPYIPLGRARGHLEFRGVGFSYLPDQPVLHDLHFEIKPGEKVAVVGPTGSGKSTLAHLITRLYDTTRGEILLDGHNVRQWRLEDLRASVSTVPQHVYLFTGSAADNIRLFDTQITPERVTKAAEAVAADTFIRRLAKGYDENLMEAGQSLSTGQKQLLAFARAFVANPALLILDEATSSIDSETEAITNASLDRLLVGRTAILIAHRLSTIQRVDRILVLNRGHLVEQGHHDELMGTDGLYRHLWQLQALKGA